MKRRPVILCVDDQWNWLEGRKMLLEERGYQVLVVTNGVEALHFLTSHPVDLVLLDYHMPHMNGDVVADHMKVVQPDVPIAMLSGDEELPEDALRSVDAFVSKGEPPACFLEIVDRLVDLRFLFAPLNGSRTKRSARICSAE